MGSPVHQAPTRDPLRRVVLTLLVIYLTPALLAVLLVGGVAIMGLALARALGFELESSGSRPVAPGDGRRRDGLAILAAKADRSSDRIHGLHAASRTGNER